jgi:hypothetical protein
MSLKKIALLGLILACMDVEVVSANSVQGQPPSPVWSFDSNTQNFPVVTLQQKEAYGVYEFIQRSVAVWNAHDVADYVGLFFGIRRTWQS